MKVFWELPIVEDKQNKEKVSKSAKYHCFISENNESGVEVKMEESLCKKHNIFIGLHEGKTTKQIKQEPALACKKCLALLNKRYGI